MARPGHDETPEGSSKKTPAKTHSTRDSLRGENGMFHTALEETHCYPVNILKTVTLAVVAHPSDLLVKPRGLSDTS